MENIEEEEKKKTIKMRAEEERKRLEIDLPIDTNFTPHSVSLDTLQSL